MLACDSTVCDALRNRTSAAERSEWLCCWLCEVDHLYFVVVHGAECKFNGTSLL